MEGGGADVCDGEGAECGLGKFGAAVDSGTGGDASVAISVVVVEGEADADCLEDEQKAGEGGDTEWQQQQRNEWGDHIIDLHGIARISVTSWS